MASSNGEAELHHIDRTPEYTEFIEKVRAYHSERGTNFDPEPRVGNIHLDLFKVFNHVVVNGGYDKISDEKLAWRRIANELGIISTNEAGTAFALKEKFYKNLAAYEIKFIHNQEPPPKDILEDTTAKGAGLLTRTRENFRGAKRESTVIAEPMLDSPARVAGANTPMSARASRGLREAPPQRVIFQPDTGSSKASRSSAHQNQRSGHNTPSHPSQHNDHQQPGQHGHPMHNQQMVQPPRPNRNIGIYNEKLDLVDADTEPYDPKITLTINVKPVDTPSNNHAEFLRRRQVEKIVAAGGPRPPFQPGKGFEGPNIYLRCLYALRSSIIEEQTYALNHLVKISYERGDKYKFESFPGLVEGLVQKALEVGSLFYHVNWQINWTADPTNTHPGSLDGVEGTLDILERIANLVRKDVQDEVQPAEFSDTLTLYNEAVLTIRNMVTLPENALYLSEFAPAKDLLCIILNLPNQESVVEMKHAALDIAEQITPYLVLRSNDPLYISLLAQMNSNDRGIILSALRALGRISMNLDAANALENIPVSVLERIYQYLLLGDEELIDAGLDFLYQYTAVTCNVEKLLKNDWTIQLITYLVYLLSHGAKRVSHELTMTPEKTLPSTQTIPVLPPSVVDQLMSIEEPQRVHRWIRCTFEEDPTSHITQLSAWQAYQNAFFARVKAREQIMITPADFIRNCTTPYKGAMPQVVEEGGAQKFIINGLRPRVEPTTLDDQPCRACPCVKTNFDNKNKVKCGEFQLSAKALLDHVLAVHIGVKANAEGKFTNRTDKFTCVWHGCSRGREPREMSLLEFASHIRTHISNFWGTSPISSPVSKKPTQSPAATSAAPPSGAGLSVPPTTAPSATRNSTPSTANTPAPATPAQLPIRSVKKAKKDWVVPRKTFLVKYVETAVTRDERNPNGPLQAAGIPLSAVLVLRNIAMNVKDDVDDEDRENSKKALLFYGSLDDLFRVMTENRAMAPQVSTLIHAIYE